MFTNFLLSQVDLWSLDYILALISPGSESSPLPTHSPTNILLQILIIKLFPFSLSSFIFVFYFLATSACECSLLCFLRLRRLLSESIIFHWKHTFLVSKIIPLLGDQRLSTFSRQKKQTLVLISFWGMLHFQPGGTCCSSCPLNSIQYPVGLQPTHCHCPTPSLHCEPINTYLTCPRLGKDFQGKRKREMNLSM